MTDDARAALAEALRTTRWWSHATSDFDCGRWDNSELAAAILAAMPNWRLAPAGALAAARDAEGLALPLHDLLDGLGACGANGQHHAWNRIVEMAAALIAATPVPPLAEP